MPKLAPKQTIDKKRASFNHPTAETMTASSLDFFPDVAGPSNLNRPDLTPQNILALQRTIGNQAVQRLIKQNQAEPAVQRLPGVARPASLGPVIQRFPSYNAFEKGWQKKAPGQDFAIFSSQPVDDAHMAKLKGSSLKPTIQKANILMAYQRYDTERSAEALSELFHTINYWETLTQRYTTEKWYKPAIDYLGELKNKIKVKIQKKTDKQHGTKIIKAKNPFQAVPWSRTNQTAKIKNWGAQQSQQAMPGFLREVGVSEAYFAKHIKGHKDRIKALQDFYSALEAGNMNAAVDAYNWISEVPGMYLIKPLFIRHFAGNIEMGKLIGTDAQANVGQGLTAEEKNAILGYTGNAYTPMNEQLRTAGETKRFDTNFPVDVDQRLEPNLAGYGKRVKEQKGRDKQQSSMELVVSGLNKFPKFNGVSYRGLKTVPNSYFDVVQPGAMLVDLAFQSASASLEGARYYLSDKVGSREVYFMIHTKTAVNIVDVSGIPKEAEVLFRPGTRFQVKAVWQYVKGRVPKNAPTEAQMMLHSLGEERSASDTNESFSGKTRAEHKEAIRVAGLIGTPEEVQGLQSVGWNKVKVIEVNEV